MTWFRLRQWARASLWLVPLACGIAGWLLSVALIELDDATPSFEALDFTSSTATQLLSAFAGAAVAFTGFAFSVLLLVVQLAGSQLSPRATRLAYRGLLSRISLGLWVATLAFSISALESVTGDFVPQLTVAAAGILVFVSVIVFLFLIGRTSRILRPAPMGDLVTRAGRRALSELHPDRREDDPPAPAAPGGEVVRHRGRGGVVVNVDVAGLVRLAAAAGGQVAVVPAVGAYVSPGDPLLRVAGGAPDEQRLRAAVIVGAERSFERDPSLALRILADISIRALSPAVNDPTTSAQMLKRVLEMLDDLAGRRLGPSAYRDAGGTVRVVLAAPEWDDYLAVGLAETIRYGAGSPQVARALRAMLLGLRGRVDGERRAAVDHRLALLDEAVAADYPGPLARAEALVADRAGFGA